jgi:RimJ/RimL family protein N-acetyltransferase
VTVTFVPVTKEHLPLLRRWMSQPHWQEWWGEPDTELGYIVAMIEGRDSTEPYLFQVDERPVGYIQVWYVKPHQVEPWTKDSPWLLELPPETVGVDLSIGEADDLAKGYGAAALSQFVGELRGRGHAEIIIDPDPANTRAVRAYLKAGFRPISHLEGRFDGILLMRHETQQ